MSRRSGRIGFAAVFAAVAGISLSLGNAFASDAVLIASTVPGYVPGTVVSAKDRLSIPEGATATLLFQTGEMLRLGGPFDGTLEQQPAKRDGGGVAVLADLFRMNGVDASIIGGTREASAGRSAVAIDDVEVDPERSGTYCIGPATSIWIARPADRTHAYAVRRQRRSRALGWPGDAARVEWPGDVPIEDGSQFEIAADGGSHVTVTFRTMPGDITPGPAEVATGVLLGCHLQYDGALRKIGRSVAAQ